jgi:PAS domain S-box-containing protein
MTELIDLSSLCLLLIGTLNLAIGIYVFYRCPGNPLNRSFTFLAVTLTGWTLALAIGRLYPDVHVQALRVAFAAGSLVPVGIVVFVERFPVSQESRPVSGLWLIGPAAALLVFLSFSDLVVNGNTLQSHGMQATYGPLHPVYAIYLLLCFAYVAKVLATKYRMARGLARVQVRYVFFAFVIPGLLATISNAIVPFVFKTSAYSRYGPVLTLLLLGLVSHAIIRHRLMDIRVVIRRSVVYLAAFAVTGGTFVFLLIGSNLFFPDEHWFTNLEIALALAVAVLFQPLKAWLQLSFDRYLYHEPYDYPQVIRETSRTLSSTIELSDILDCIGGVIRDTFKPETTTIYLLPENETEYEEVWGIRETKDRHLESSSPLLEQARDTQVLVFRDELSTRPNGGEALAQMDRDGIDVLAPLVEEGRLFGLIAVGPKRSGNPYFSNDADLLQTLAHQSAIAIRNAQTHQRVVQVNEELQKTLATIENGVVVVGARGRITVFNKAAEALTGLTGGGICGHGIEQLPPVLARLLEAALERHESQSEVEIALPDAAGQLLPLMCTTSLLRNPQGAVVGAVAVFSDLSRLKELEHERRRTERLASIEAIASGMVHEIRNPLAAIKTFTQLLHSRFDDASFRESFCRVAGREIARIDELLERFRTLASASRQPMEPVDITVPIRNTLELLQPQLDGRGIRLRRVGDSSPRPVLGNASQLEQLFLNLCLNALEAMDSDGELTVRVADLSEGGGSTLLVEISDTGTGISEELLDRVFNPFVTTKTKGTGLGLAICRAIADAHRAILRVRNNIGRPGCTFTIEFPVPTTTPTRVPA